MIKDALMITKQNLGNKTNSWDYSLSILRVLACLGIIVLHVFHYATLGVSHFQCSLLRTEQFWSELFQNINLWAVPIFLMVTGALLLNPNHSVTYHKIFKSYIARIAYAILLFGYVFLLIDMLLGDKPWSWASVEIGSLNILTGHSWSHMWYLYLLIGLYLLLPCFRKITANSTNKEIIYLLCVGVAFLSFLPILNIWGVQTDYRFSIATIYPFYLFLGYALHNRIISMRKYQSYGLLILSIAGLVVTTCWGSVEVKDYFASYNSILIIIMAASVFSIFSQVTRVNQVDSRKYCHKLLMSFDKCSFGIYLIHMIFIKIVIRVFRLNLFLYPWAFPLVIIGVALVSWGIVLVLHQIPGLKKVI